MPDAEPVIEFPRGYVMTQNDTWPGDATGYGMVIFSDLAQARDYCGDFTGYRQIRAQLNERTDLRGSVKNEPSRAVPFIWPVTQWAGNRYDCEQLVRYYNLEGALIYLKRAQQGIKDLGSRVTLRVGGGPYFVVKRFANPRTVIYDFSRVTRDRRSQWIDKVLTDLTTLRPTKARMVVSPSVRDQARFFVFKSVPQLEQLIAFLLPAYKPQPHQR